MQNLQLGEISGATMKSLLSWATAIQQLTANIRGRFRVRSHRRNMRRRAAVIEALPPEIQKDIGGTRRLGKETPDKEGGC
jgi:hypothetical protein